MKNPHTLIIAEAGVNHNGSLENAKKLVDIWLSNEFQQGRSGTKVDKINKIDKSA